MSPSVKRFYQMNNKRFCLGLTGSIGMGKTTVATMFAAHGVSIWNADDAVKRIYQTGGGGSQALRDIVPNSVCQPEGRINKKKLMRILECEPNLLDKIESAIHPLVKRDRKDFMSRTKNGIVVAEVPLLFETQSQSEFDAVAVVVAPAEIQKDRVMKRHGMTAERFEFLKSRQMSDAEKRRRADYVICSVNRDTAKRDVIAILSRIRGSKR